MIGIAVLFLVPIYYVARSKGYNGGRFATLAAVLAVLAVILGSASRYLDLPPAPVFGILQLVLPAAVLGGVMLLKTRTGAPGKAYLKICFACPECGASLTFRREREGLAELCPKCGEVITVPTDKFSPPAPVRNRAKPVGVKGEVCYAVFGQPQLADELRSLLEANGILARVIGGDAGGVLPQLGGSQGFKVIIDAADWDLAVELETGKQVAPADSQ